MPGIQCVPKDQFLRCVIDHYNDTPPPPSNPFLLLSQPGSLSRPQSLAKKARLAQRRDLLLKTGGVYTYSRARKTTPHDPQP